MNQAARAALRQRLYTVIFKTDTRAGKLFDEVLLGVILFSVLLALVESVGPIRSRFSLSLSILEWIVTACFAVEYAIRIFCAPRRRAYIFSFYGIIDLLAILPSFLGLLVGGTQYLVVIRAIRLLRVFRILQLSHFIREGNFLLSSLQRSVKKIALFIFFVLIIAVILGALMYVVESPVNPSFANIPQSIYWAIVTITTVGYGDITPVTFAGQLISAAVMLLGYAIIAVPTGVVSSEMIRQFHRKRLRCVRCGAPTHDVNARYCDQCGTVLPADEAPAGAH